MSALQVLASFDEQDSDGGNAFFQFRNLGPTQTISFHDVYVSQINHMLAHPRAKEVNLYNCKWDLLSEQTGHPNSLVHTVGLVECSIDDTGITDILLGFPKLRKLTYYHSADEEYTHFDMIGRALRIDGRQLEHLTIRHQYYQAFATSIGPLYDLNNLTTLEIDLELLAGFHPSPPAFEVSLENHDMSATGEIDYDALYEEVGDWSLVNILPTSLVELKVHVDQDKFTTYYNKYERYGAKFEALLASDHRFAHLICIKAPNLNGAVRATRNRLTNWLSDSMGTIIRLPRPMVMTLTGEEKQVVRDRIRKYFHSQFLMLYGSSLCPCPYLEDAGIYDDDQGSSGRDLATLKSMLQRISIMDIRMDTDMDDVQN
ncbi:hypothetical protein GGS21DRAFT_45696 [Xylaria nigripes]|nr:hypothetical protein GGS21DRAFT_45696 [Xylaria nigripes]